MGALLLGGALPIGCGPRPEPTSSGLTAPGRFREGTDAPARWPDPDWWRGFNAPELDRLMARAAAQNLDLAAAAARVRQADANLRITGASLFPSITTGGDAGRSRPAGANGVRGQGRNSFQISLGASYEVDFWGRNRNATEAARQSLRAREFDLGTVLLTTEASVANTYFTILEAQEELRVQEANLRAARQILTVIRSQVTGGTATGLDLAQQETVVAQQEAAVPPLRQTVAQNIAALATLVGVPPVDLEIAGQGLERIRVPDVSPGLPSELLARRPDVLSAEADLAGANANIAAARAALLPSITLSAQGGYQAALLGTLLRPEALFYSIAASLVQTVFDGGELRGRVALSRAQAEELLANYRLAILTAFEEVDSALAGLRETTDQDRLLREAASRAERAYSIAEGQLRGGVINLITLLNVQQTLFTARRNVTRGQLQRLQAAVGLFRALGGGWGPGVPVARAEGSR
ncbi:efflux transporter outer membrane subunit [Muricoccus radiodurans]|uniref:efflux transporter outer membrane subunit n=1 Tax=Muricoccus radiodurans TaxID=2231721 RepID=UPI003CF21ACE